MVQAWASVNAIHHALKADKEMPPGSKQEAEKETNWAEMARYKKWREEHDHDFRQALMSPRHFGAYIGMESVLGAPDPESVRSFEEAQAEERARNERLPEESKVYFLNDSILARAVREGRGFSPSE